MKGVIKLIGALALSATLGGPETAYFHHDMCGEVNWLMKVPLTYVTADTDNDGKKEHFFANWRGVEQYDKTDGSYEKEATIYDRGNADSYTCVDLRLKDLDGDGDLDMVYASTTERMVFKNKRGRFSLESRVEHDLDKHTDVRIKLSRKKGSYDIGVGEAEKE